MWVCRNVICTTLIFDGRNPTHQNGDEWGMVQMTLLYEHYLVGGFNPSEKYEFVNWDDDIPKSYMEK